MIFVDSGNSPFRFDSDDVADSPSCKWITINGDEMYYKRPDDVDDFNRIYLSEGKRVYYIS